MDRNVGKGRPTDSGQKGRDVPALPAGSGGEGTLSTPPRAQIADTTTGGTFDTRRSGATIGSTRQAVEGFPRDTSTDVRRGREEEPGLAEKTGATSNGSSPEVAIRRTAFVVTNEDTTYARDEDPHDKVVKGDALPEEAPTSGNVTGAGEPPDGGNPPKTAFGDPDDPRGARAQEIVSNSHLTVDQKMKLLGELGLSELEIIEHIPGILDGFMKGVEEKFAEADQRDQDNREFNRIVAADAANTTEAQEAEDTSSADGTEIDQNREPSRIFAKGLDEIFDQHVDHIKKEPDGNEDESFEMLKLVDDDTFTEYRLQRFVQGGIVTFGHQAIEVPIFPLGDFTQQDYFLDEAGVLRCFTTKPSTLDDFDTNRTVNEADVWAAMQQEIANAQMEASMGLNRVPVSAEAIRAKLIDIKRAKPVSVV